MEHDLFIAKEDIVCGLDATDKASAIAQLVGHVSKTMPLDTVALTKLLLTREQKKTSGCGKQIAIVHLINPIIPNMKVALGTFKSPVPWDSVDGKPVLLAAIIVAPPRMLKEYFPLIIRVAKTLAEDSTRLSLTNMGTPAQIMTVLNAAKERYA